MIAPPSGRSFGQFFFNARSSYIQVDLTSRYPTIPLQLLYLAAQYILSVITTFVAGETSGAGQGLCLALDRDEKAPRVWSVVVSHWVNWSLYF
jgi:hypothetical protein